MRTTVGGDYELIIKDNPHGFMESALSGKHDLILVDAAGEELAEICQSLKKGIELEWTPIVIIADSPSDHITALENGANDFLLRNADPRLLQLKLRNLIHCKLVHQQVRESEIEIRRRIEELESLIEMAVHDLKSPVIAIDGFIAMLDKRCRDLPPDPKRDEILSYLSATNSKMQEFIKDLTRILFSEEVKLEFSRISLQAAFQEALHRRRRAIEEKRIEITTHADPSLGRVLADERRIVEVFDNLMGNAVNYMGEGPGLRIQVSFREQDDTVVVSLSDNGIGIPTQYHEQIFRRFFRVPRTGAKPGTGLGLSIVKTIVESHGGRIWVESQPGQGTTFSFTLPKDQPACVHDGTDRSCLLNA
jgi:signal transduction histidine kinase